MISTLIKSIIGDKPLPLWAECRWSRSYEATLVYNALMDQWCPFIWIIHCRENNDDVIKWKHFPCYWPFVRGIHRSPVNSPSQMPVTRGFDVSLICAWTKAWVNNRYADDLRRHYAHYDVTVMCGPICETHDMLWLSDITLPFSLVYQSVVCVSTGSGYDKYYAN